MEDRDKFDAQLEMPIPGRRQQISRSTLQAETDSLRAMGAWANQMRGQSA